MARPDRDSQRLNTPGARRRFEMPTMNLDRDAFGQFAEGFARFMGTARFLAWMSVIVIVWVLWNIPVGPERPRFDPFPFIFLTLVLSLQASYAAPLILLAQNRQDDRDRINLEQDRAVNARSVADTEYLTREVADVRFALGEVVTRDFLRSELQRVVEELGDGPRPAAAADS